LLVLVVALLYWVAVVDFNCLLVALQVAGYCPYKAFVCMW
jgi:hypothetical protein